YTTIFLHYSLRNSLSLIERHQHRCQLLLQYVLVPPATSQFSTLPSWHLLKPAFQPVISWNTQFLTVFQKSAALHPYSCQKITVFEMPLPVVSFEAHQASLHYHVHFG